MPQSKLNRMKFAVLMFLPLLALPILTLLTENRDGTGWIANYNYMTDGDHDFSELALKKEIIFDHPTIMDLSAKLLSQFTELESLHVAYGTAKKVYIKPTLDYVYVHSCKTVEVVIDSQADYQTTSFEVSSCLLTSVPKNLERLKSLKILQLTDNNIEHVDMKMFNSFEKMEVLTLNNNGIKVLSSSVPISMPKLEWLRLSSNKIRELNVCQWNMPALEELYLHDNKLAYVTNVLNQFPKLTKMSLYGNPFNCDWKNKFIEDNEKTNVRMYQGEPTCSVRLFGYFRSSPKTC